MRHTEQIIIDNRDYVRVNGSFIVNRNEEEYRAALMRRKNTNRMQAIEERVSGLEQKLDSILNLLLQQRET